MCACHVCLHNICMWMSYTGTYCMHTCSYSWIFVAKYSTMCTAYCLHPSWVHCVLVCRLRCGKVDDQGMFGCPSSDTARGKQTAIYLTTYPPSYLPTYLPTHPPIHPSSFLPTYLHTYLPTYLPTYLSTHCVSQLVGNRLGVISLALYTTPTAQVVKTGLLQPYHPTYCSDVVHSAALHVPLPHNILTILFPAVFS